MQFHLLEEGLGRRRFTGVVRLVRRVGARGFRVADVLEHPCPQVAQAVVIRQDQAGPRVALGHIQRRDGHGTPHLVAGRHSQL